MNKEKIKQPQAIFYKLQLMFYNVSPVYIFYFIVKENGSLIRKKFNNFFQFFFSFSVNVKGIFLNVFFFIECS